MPKANSPSGSTSKAKPRPLSDTNKELKAVSGQLLETAGTMHSFMLSLQNSGFKAYMDYLGSPWRSFWLNFLFGIGRGLGFVVGATVVVALVIWIVSQILTQLPFVGDFFQFLSTALSAENLEKLQSGEFIQQIQQMLGEFKTGTIPAGDGAIPPLN